MVLAAEKYNDSSPLNLASGKEISIKDLAHIIKKKIDYKGKIVWDKTKPTGPKRRLVSINKAKKFIGFKPSVSVEKGLENTIKWYQKNFK